MAVREDDAAPLEQEARSDASRASSPSSRRAPRAKEETIAVTTLKVPDLAEAVVGWRAWRFGMGPPRLRSLSQESFWPAREPLTAVCYLLPSRLDRRWADFQPHLAPRPDCHCGVYAARNESDVHELLRARRHRWYYAAPVRVEVTGEVALWGRLIEHEQGYRAEHAYPRRLIVPANFCGYLEEPGARTVRRVLAKEAAALITEAYGIEAVVA